MTTDLIASFSVFYFLIAMVAGIFIARKLESRLKASIPATRPYRWGFYFGCLGVACLPLAIMTMLAMVVAGTNGKFETLGSFLGYTVFFSIHSVSGWFIIKRKRWAWVVGTVFSCNIVLMVTNYIYGGNRWGEFIGQAYGSTGTVDEGYELLHLSLIHI